MSPVYTRGLPINPANQPLNNGGTITDYQVSPALPTGILLNQQTGFINGTPTVLVTVPQTYTITGTNNGGFTTCALSIAVVDGKLSEM